MSMKSEAKAVGSRKYADPVILLTVRECVSYITVI